MRRIFFGIDCNPAALAHRTALACHSILSRAAVSCLLLACFVIPAIAAGSPTNDVVLRALKEEMDRSKTKLKMDNVAAPYYIEYRVTELDAFEASAVFGALRSQQRGSGRFLRVVVRIGDYKQDSYYSSGEGAVDMIPLDGDTFAIRHRV